MSDLRSRVLLVASVCSGALLCNVLLGGSSSSALVGEFLADGALEGTAEENGETQSGGQVLTDVPLQFTAAHGALIEGFTGTWKEKHHRCSANFDQAFTVNVGNAYPDCKVTAKLGLKKIEVVGDDLTTKLFKRFKAKKPGYKIKLKTSGVLLGERV